MDKARLIAAIKAVPGVVEYLTPAARGLALKAAPITRDELERQIAAAILRVDRSYLRALEANDGRVPFDFWQSYESDLRAEISTPLRKYVEQSFTNYSDYAAFIDQGGAVADIDTMMTNAITRASQGISQNTQAQLNQLLAQNLTAEEIIERIALRFSASHATQVAITELTRAEAFFSEALSMRLSEQGVTTVIRWLTAEDEKVCPICGPADHKTKDQPVNAGAGWNGQTWGQRYGGPPAHPNCRCQTVVEISKK
jgi:hypothetical protein